MTVTAGATRVLLEHENPLARAELVTALEEAGFAGRCLRRARAYLPDCSVLLALSAEQRARQPILDSLATTIPRSIRHGDLVDAVRRLGGTP